MSNVLEVPLRAANLTTPGSTTVLTAGRICYDPTADALVMGDGTTQAKDLPRLPMDISSALKLLHYGDPTLTLSSESDFTIDSGTGRITAYSGTDAVIVVPWQIGGVTVTGIGDKDLPEGVFSSITSPNTTMTHIYFPQTCTYLGRGCCIGASNLKRAIGEGVTEAGDSAFDNCGSLRVEIGDLPNLVTIGVGCFNEGGWAYIALPSAASLGSSPFSLSPNLRAVVFGGNAPSHGTDTFEDSPDVVVYRLHGTTGWGATFEGRPVVTVNRLEDAYHSMGELTLGERTGSVKVDALWAGLITLEVGAGDISGIAPENLDKAGIILHVDNSGDNSFALGFTVTDDLTLGEIPAGAAEFDVSIEKLADDRHKVVISNDWDEVA